VVYCNGLENPAGIAGKTPETPGLREFGAAHNAPFPARSADRDGANVGTNSPSSGLAQMLATAQLMAICAAMGMPFVQEEL